MMLLVDTFSSQKLISNRTKKFLREVRGGPNNLTWAPSSPDCNVCDYWLWKEMKKYVNDRLTGNPTREMICRLVDEFFNQLSQNDIGKFRNIFVLNCYKIYDRL